MELDLEEETLDISWLQEEESLIHMDSIPQKKPLERIELRMFFVDSQMCMREIHPCMVELDVSENASILSKECVLKHIEKAKREYTDIYASSGAFTLLDILIWNITVGAEHIQSFTGDKSCDKSCDKTCDTNQRRMGQPDSYTARCFQILYWNHHSRFFIPNSVCLSFFESVKPVPPHPNQNKPNVFDFNPNIPIRIHAKQTRN